MSTRDSYYVPATAPYSVILSAGMFIMLTGFVFKMNAYPAGNWVMLAGTLVVLSMVFRWFGSIIGESEGGIYKKWEDGSFRIGMVWFIASEVAFFAAFFGALFYLRTISVPRLAEMDPAFTLYPGFIAAWPSAGPKGLPFTPMAAWGLPAINTALLLLSGVTVTWAHWGLLANKRKQLIMGLVATVALGISFLTLQAVEYHHAYTELGLTMGAGVYGSTFFMLTGFHGFHVTLGVIMLSVILMRSMKGHFTPEQHFGFEGVAWYWHFVDVVWLGLFVFVYWL